MKTHDMRRSSRLFFVALVAALAATLFASAASTQAGKKPITRKGLVEAVKINGLSTTEMIQFIQRRGVDFEMTADAEQELQQAGARPEVVEAARSNYRPPATETAVATPAARPANTPPRNNAGQPVPQGPPLSKNEIVTMLQGGIASSRVEQFVEARGVTFALTPDITSEIKSAGGDRSLIGAITEKGPAQTADNSANSSSPSPFGSNTAAQPAANNAPDYDDFIDRASSAISAQDWNSAMNYAALAARHDPAQPRAYTLLGTMLLYVRQDVNSAEQAMRAAIERGGSAAFHVYHDHDGAFGQYCEGSFFVTKSGVSYKANDGRDTFETDDSNIKEVKTNTFMGINVGAFHVKPVQQINGRSNFNFAPGTQNKAEAELIIRLIKAY